MSVLLKSKSIPFWFLIPVALGIHGLILCIPIALEEPAQEKPKSDPVKMQKLPPLKGSIVPKPKSSPSPSGAIVPPTPITNSSISTVAQPIVSNPAQQPASQTTTPPQSSAPQPIAPPVPPVPAPTVPPKTPDIFQIQGTTACDNVKDCYVSIETNGRSIAQTLEQTLRAQGYTLAPIELAEDTGMKVYHLFQNGQPKDYLHIIWSDKGTRSLRLPKPEINRDRLALEAKL